MKARSVVAATAMMMGFCAAIPEAEAEEKRIKKDDGYGYIFADDVLDAGNPSATGGVINVVKMGRRDRLLRPRVHFIPEMLKSVETM